MFFVWLDYMSCLILVVVFCISNLYVNVTTTLRSQKFCNILVVCASLLLVYHVTVKQLQPWKINTMVCSILVVGTLIHCALVHFVCGLKAVQMNVQFSLIWEFLLYELKLNHNSTEAQPKTFVMWKVKAKLITVW